MALKIYTRAGDKGETSLFGSKTKVNKSHIRVVAYGSVDELNSNLGMLIEFIDNNIKTSLLENIQEELFIIGANLSSVEGKAKKQNIPILNSQVIDILEKEIDEIQEKLPPLKYFILPRGNKVVCWAHICRCVCRRAEREVVKLSLEEEIDDIIIIYLNRLSDYFFTLSRFIAQQTNSTQKPWIPKK